MLGVQGHKAGRVHQFTYVSTVHLTVLHEAHQTLWRLQRIAINWLQRLHEQCRHKHDRVSALLPSSRSSADAVVLMSSLCGTTTTGSKSSTPSPCTHCTCSTLHYITLLYSTVQAVQYSQNSTGSTGNKNGLGQVHASAAGLHTLVGPDG
jgi:hypothetical protein